MIIFRSSTTAFLASLLLMVQGVTVSSAEPATAKGSLDYFFSEKELWILDGPKVEARLTPEGLTKVPMSGEVNLGDERAMMAKNASLFQSFKVWKAKLGIGGQLVYVIFEFVPPPTLAQPMSKGEFKSTLTKLEAALTNRFKTKPTPYAYESPPETKVYKTTCMRWVDADHQCILSTLTLESGSEFKVLRFDLKLRKSWPAGNLGLTKPPALKYDRTTGISLLEGVPPVPVWAGQHPEWSLLEQSLACIGKKSDRNAMTEKENTRSLWWPHGFSLAFEQIAVQSQAKVTVLVFSQGEPAALAKLQSLCVNAAKKLGKNAPQKLVSLTDLDPEVLRAVRASPAATNAFVSSIKQSLASSKPVFWIGCIKMFPEKNSPQTPDPVTSRLIIGLNEKEGELIFADATGKPGPSMKAADALAGCFYAAVVTNK